MTACSQPKRLGFFSRLLDRRAAERYRLVAEQIVHAEKVGFDTAWVAQHHFNEDEGGLPSPLVFLAACRGPHLAHPARHRHHHPADGKSRPGRRGHRRARSAVGRPAGGRRSAPAARRRLSCLRPRQRRTRPDLCAAISLPSATPGRGGALRGRQQALSGGADTCGDRIWQATFSVGGGERAGQAGDGLMLSRTQPRPRGDPRATLAEICRTRSSTPISRRCRPGRAPRILGSRSLFVADDRKEALHLAEIGLRRSVERFAASGHVIADRTTARRPDHGLRRACRHARRRDRLACRPTRRWRASPTSSSRSIRSIRRTPDPALASS